MEWNAWEGFMFTVARVGVLAVLVMPVAALAGGAQSESAGYLSVYAGTQFANQAGTEFTLGANAESANGWLLDAFAGTTQDAESNGVVFDPRYWSVSAGKRFGSWRASVGFAAFEDGVQVESQDVTALISWQNERVSIAIDALFGEVDETVEINIPVLGPRTFDLTTDRLGFGVRGDVSIGEYLSIGAGYRRYDYDPSADRLAARPRLQQYLITNVFTARRGLVDSSWNVGAAAFVASVTISVDFAQSDELNGSGTSDDLRVGLEVPVGERWSLAFGAGRFTSSGAPTVEDSNTYGSITVRYTAR
jgi:hypothetical protein